jgi:hypothetical protein
VTVHALAVLRAARPRDDELGMVGAGGLGPNGTDLIGRGQLR